MREVNLPKLLSSENTWDEARANEVRELFASEVYGRYPTSEYTTDFQLVKREKPDELCTKEEWRVTITAEHGSHSIPFYLYLPNKVQKAPLILYVGIHARVPKVYELPAEAPQDVRDIFEAAKKENDRKAKEAGTKSLSAPKSQDLANSREDDIWPVNMLLQRGYATAAFHTEDVDPDYPTDLKQGIMKIFDGDERKADSWATIAAWSFGAMRIVDCLFEHPGIDNKHIAITGHSRGGKTSLLTAANDKRVSCCLCNNSGSTGSAVARGKVGETIHIINSMVPYWFCDNYKKYNKKEDELPVDQHMLVACVAPRLLYIVSASEDEWADPMAEFLGAWHGSKAYEALGLKGLCIDEMPSPKGWNHEGLIGYHLREGDHRLTPAEWTKFCEFWEEKRDSNI